MCLRKKKTNIEIEKNEEREKKESNECEYTKDPGLLISLIV